MVCIQIFLCFSSMVQKLLAIEHFKYLRVFRWQTTSNIRSVSSSWLSTSQANPLPLALSGTSVSMVIWGSNGKPTFPTRTGCTRDTAEAHWQHGNWWQSCWIPSRDQPLRTFPRRVLYSTSSFSNFSVSVCPPTHTEALKLSLKTDFH